jgi:hypothetical protein
LQLRGFLLWVAIVLGDRMRKFATFGGASRGGLAATSHPDDVLYRRLKKGDSTGTFQLHYKTYLFMPNTSEQRLAPQPASTSNGNAADLSTGTPDLAHLIETGGRQK